MCLGKPKLGSLSRRTAFGVSGSEAEEPAGGGRAARAVGKAGDQLWRVPGAAGARGLGSGVCVCVVGRGGGRVRAAVGCGDVH